jgi:hypothetical protein
MPCPRRTFTSTSAHYSAAGEPFPRQPEHGAQPNRSQVFVRHEKLLNAPRRLTHQSLHFAILGLARRRDSTDSIRLDGRYEHDEAQRSDGERGETQNVFHISSYPFSTSRRTAASAAGSVANSDAAGFSVTAICAIGMSACRFATATAAAWLCVVARPWHGATTRLACRSRSVSELAFRQHQILVNWYGDSDDRQLRDYYRCGQNGYGCSRAAPHFHSFQNAATDLKKHARSATIKL